MPLDITTLTVISLATISVRQLLVADRLTQWPRHKVIAWLDSAGGFIPYHIIYWFGCIACLPLWVAAAFWVCLENEVPYTEAVAMIFAARYLAQTVAIFFGDDENRDFGDGMDFPPDTPAQRRAVNQTG